MERMKRKIKEQWSKLTDDEIALYADNRQEFIDKLQARYGKTREQMEKELRQFEQACGCDVGKAA